MFAGKARSLTYRVAPLRQDFPTLIADIAPGWKAMRWASVYYSLFIPIVYYVYKMFYSIDFSRRSFFFVVSMLLANISIFKIWQQKHDQGQYYKLFTAVITPLAVYFSMILTELCQLWHN
jgi:hypothetical protein